MLTLTNPNAGTVRLVASRVLVSVKEAFGFQNFLNSAVAWAVPVLVSAFVRWLFDLPWWLVAAVALATALLVAGLMSEWRQRQQANPPSSRDPTERIGIEAVGRSRGRITNSRIRNQDRGIRADGDAEVDVDRTDIE